MEWHILIYLSYKKSSNICKNLQHYSQDVNYYETVKKMYKKAIKFFYQLTTCTLPVYGNQMNRASLKLTGCPCVTFSTVCSGSNFVSRWIIHALLAPPSPLSPSISIRPVSNQSIRHLDLLAPNSRPLQSHTHTDGIFTRIIRFSNFYGSIDRTCFRFVK